MKKLSHKFKVLKEFWMRHPETNFMVIVKEGEILEQIPPASVIELLQTGRIEPHEWPEKIECEVIRSGAIRTPEKLISVATGEVVILDKSEATILMLNRTVRACDKRFDLSYFFASGPLPQNLPEFGKAVFEHQRELSYKRKWGLR